MPKPGIKQVREKFDKSNVKCFNCQEKGHYAHECRAKKKSPNGAWLGMVPNLCNTLGSCLIGNLNGRKVQMIIDSGRSRVNSLVNEKFVCQDYYSGDSIMIITANGDIGLKSL
jgi:hypothetical protein